jgi:excisionase family DNA binding protein
LDKLFSVGEVAFMLGLHVQTVQRWCAAHRLQAVRLGLRWRVPAEEIERIRREGLPR